MLSTTTLPLPYHAFYAALYRQKARAGQELDVVVDGFLGRPLDGGPYPYLACYQPLHYPCRTMKFYIFMLPSIGRRHGLEPCVAWLAPSSLKAIK